MSTLNGILGIATSALQTAQTGLSVVSDNISNVNTAGYIRKTTSQTSLTAAGAGQGVSIAKVNLAANAYLQEVALRAASDSSRAGAVYNNLNQAQSQFGDPSAAGSLFANLDSVFSSFATLASSNTSSNQSQSLNQLRSFLNNASSIKNNLDALKTTTTSQVATDVAQVNDLLKKISDLNSDINRSSTTSSDVTGYQNQQSEYVDQLSKLIDIRVTPDANATGAITIRASDGTPLTGIGRSPATFSYDQSSGTGQLLFTPAGGAQQPFGGRLTSGELQGLLTSLNTDLPNLSQELAQLIAGAATALNAASNAHSATPAPASLTGKDTGIDVPSAIAGFTGKTTVAIVNAAGVIQTSVAIDFSAGTLSVNGAAATSFTAANFVTSLNTALGASGSASVNGNVLTLAAAGGNGVAVADDATSPSQAGGKGFSQYFGLNDAITTPGQSDYNTGLPGTGLSGFNSGTIQFRIGASNGATIANISVTPTSGQTLSGLITQLNATSGGLGQYGSFSLDSKGAIAFTPTSGSSAQLTVTSDTTARNGTGPSFTQLFGIDPTARADRTTNFAVNAKWLANPSLVPNASLNLSAAAGTVALSSGDTRGIDALAQAGKTALAFPAAGALPASSKTVSDYASAVSGQIAGSAAAAQSTQTNADTTLTEANKQRSSVEGVNMDQELINLTTYQQAYNASARLITAAKDMMDTLLQTVQ